MKKIKEFFADMTETVSVTKLDGTLIVAIAALSGVIIGMLISPRKNAKYGCGNGTTYITNNGEDDWDGSNYYGGMAEGLVQLTNLASFAAEGTQEKVDEATAEILSGSNNVFDGVMETNTGETVGTENGTLDDAMITGGIDWYYKNVVIVD